MRGVLSEVELESNGIEEALAQRLEAVGPWLCEPFPIIPAATRLLYASRLLDLLVGAVHADPRPERVWLLCTAVSGAFPTADDVMEGVRLFRLLTVIDATLWLLDLAIVRGGAAASEVEVVTDRVVVDVDHSARHDLHTGIQQVVRRTLPIWIRDHAVVMVAWTNLTHCFRTLSPEERDRVLRRHQPQQHEAERSTTPSLVIPWRTVVVLAETPSRQACEPIAALAEFSGNRLVAIGYDCIPIVSADLVPEYEPGRFAQYLTIIKHTGQVAAISASAAVEFRGFVEALPAQGIQGPIVVECTLPTESATFSENSTSAGVSAANPRPTALVLSVGSLEPRKNHLALLFAAERLWREGIRFELLFVGRGGWGEAIQDRVAQLSAAGRAIDIQSDVTEQDLVSAYRAARFTVFASLHEGYGLPVAESLSLGTPVITSNYGSTREIGLGGGALLIDPRDDEQLVEAIRSLLVDDELLGRLSSEIASRPTRTWEEYARDLWAVLIGTVTTQFADQEKWS